MSKREFTMEEKLQMLAMAIAVSTASAFRHIGKRVASRQRTRAK